MKCKESFYTEFNSSASCVKDETTFVKFEASQYVGCVLLQVYIYLLHVLAGGRSLNRFTHFQIQTGNGKGNGEGEGVGL